MAVLLAGTSGGDSWSAPAGRLCGSGSTGGDLRVSRHSRRRGRSVLAGGVESMYRMFYATPNNGRAWTGLRSAIAPGTVGRRFVSRWTMRVDVIVVTIC